MSLNHFRPSALALPFIFFTFFLKTSLFAQDYRKAWDALSKNDWKTAKTHLEAAQKEPATAADAALTMQLLTIFEGRDAEGIPYFDKARKVLPDPYPYYYALWNVGGITGPHGLKEYSRAKFLEALTEDPKCPPMLAASARYHLSFHYLAKSDFKKFTAIKAPITNVTTWQYTGPFDNVSESGFDKNYPPIEQAEPGARFKSTNNAEIRWMAPDVNYLDGWTMIGHSIKWSSGVMYAQSFVTSPADMESVLAAGFTGSCKVWLNDQLLLTEQEPRVTDFDLYRVPCRLKKGVNRILVQIGVTDEEVPNFCVRMQDANGNLIPGLISSTQHAAYPKISGPLPTVMPFFAETFFQKKVAAEPDNLLNYFFLCETYLRALKSREALEAIEMGLGKSPDNLVLHFQKIKCLIKLNNRTALTEEIERIKQLDPNFLVSLQFKYQEAMGNENYDEAQEILDKKASLYGTNPDLYNERINLLLKREKFEEALRLLDEAYALYRTESAFAQMQHNVALKVKKKPQDAILIFENFLDRNYQIPVAFLLAELYSQLGNNGRAIDIYEKVYGLFPNDPSTAERLVNHYYQTKDVKKAKIWAEKLLSLAPFHSGYWENLAKIAELEDDKSTSLTNFQKALHYNPNDYDVRRQIRELQSKPDFSTLLPKNDIYQLFKNTQTAGKAGEYDWYYILDERCAILYPERTSEDYNTLLVKILNEKGIEKWKESSIGYNSARQRLIIEKAEVLKANGSKISAEQNDNELVFPNLEVGDGVYVRYRIMNYAFGRMNREYWHTHGFNAFVPTDVSRYCLYVPADMNFDIKTLNTDIKPEIKELNSDNLRQYTWEALNEPALKDEKITPAHIDIGKILHISTIPAWKDISGWYADVSAAQAKRDYDVQKLAKQLFPEGNKMSETAKARAIYTWIIKNIRYSSVSFRQSGYVPQRASKVIQTKLGDCKDLATLYAALAREVGLRANLVLINTRDQGAHAMELPSMEFNHCIVKTIADGQTWYLELTNPYLPFGSLHSNDYKATALEIPYPADLTAEAKPFSLDPPNRLKDYRQEKTNIELSKRDLVVTTACVRNGALTRIVRDKYDELPPAKRIEEMQNALAKNFNNTLTVKELKFSDLKNIIDTVGYNVRYQVKNEVSEIGELGTFKIPFHSKTFEADDFTEETRTLPVNYWEYEDTDEYQEEIVISLPAGKAFTEIPKDVSIAFSDMRYSLKYSKTAPGVLRVVREMQTIRDKISVQDYPRFREFAESVVAAETRLVAFK